MAQGSVTRMSFELPRNWICCCEQCAESLAIFGIQIWRWRWHQIRPKSREYQRMIYENLFSVREYRSLIGFMFSMLTIAGCLGRRLHHGHDSITMVMPWRCSQVVAMVTGGSRLLHWVLHVTPQLLGGSQLALKEGAGFLCGQQRLVKILGSWSCFGELGLLPWSFLMVPTWTL